MNKIKYGLSNVHFFPIESTDQKGTPTYGAAIKVAGAVSLTLSPEGESEPFYADNSVYYLVDSSNGYTGELELAYVPDEVREKIQGYTKDGSNVYFEGTADKSKEFAMAFQFEGDAKNARHLFYRCKLSRSNIDGKTKEQSVKPETEKGKFTAIARLDNQRVRAYTYAGDTAYESWFTTPYEGEKA